MKSKRQNAFIFVALILCAVSAFGQTEQEIEEKYGKPSKVYAVGMTIWMNPEYGSDGQVCRVNLSPRRFSNNMISLHSELSFIEMERVLNDIAPQSERGARGELWGYSITTNGVEGMLYQYERVSIYVKARIGFSTKKEMDKNGIEKKEPNDVGQENQEFADPIFRNAEIVVISWNDRKCDDQPTPQISKAVERVLLETAEMPIEATTLEPYEDFTGFADLDDQGLCAVASKNRVSKK